jgi:hypothetical protein
MEDAVRDDTLTPSRRNRSCKSEAERSGSTSRIVLISSDGLGGKLCLRAIGLPVANISILVPGKAGRITIGSR